MRHRIGPNSLPFDDETLGEAIAALSDPTEDFRGFRPPDDSRDSGPRGVFKDKDGNRIAAPLSRNAEASSKANQYGWLLNRYGERGNRTWWLQYPAAAARQLF